MIFIPLFLSFRTFSSARFALRETSGRTQGCYVCRCRFSKFVFYLCLMKITFLSVVLDSFEGLVEVVDDVLIVLSTDAQADRVGIDALIGCLLGTKF